MKIKLIYKIISPILLFVVGAVLFFLFFSVRSLETAMIRSAFFRMNDQVHSRFNQNLRLEDINAPFSPDAQGKFSLVANEIADSSTVHFTVWLDGQTVIFSDVDSLIGSQVNPRIELASAFFSVDGFYVIQNPNVKNSWFSASGESISMFIPVVVEGKKIVVEIEASSSVITKPIYDQVRNMIIALVIGGLAIILALYVILRTFVLNPVQGLRTAFKAFSQGNLLYPISQKQHDELGELAQSVDAMRLNLEFTINALRRERDQSSAIVSSMGEGLIVMDTDYTIRMINNTAERLLDVDGKKYVGKKMTELIEVYRQATVLPVSEWAVTLAIRTKKFVMHNMDERIYYKTPSGKMVGVLVAATPLVVDQKIEGAVILFRDVTAEQQLDEAKDSFISIASHQLRTPLTSMRWFSEMMLNGDVGKLTEQQSHFLDQVYQGTIRMISLVNLLLQTARVEAGRVRVDPVPVRIDKLAQEVVTALKTTLDKKQQKVTVKSDPGIPEIPMDRDIVWQVIQNLLTNANRYSPAAGTIEIEIVSKKTDIQVMVRDHGIGIPKKDWPKIFQKFFRAPNALKAVPEGSGLGLSLVKTLVVQWGGKLWFETEEGKGTSFFFTMPIKGMKQKEGDVKIVV